jgi:hypothetical protein
MGPQRLYSRYAFSAPAKIIDSSGSETAAQVANISVGGCRLLTSGSFSIGARVVVKIQTPTDYFETPANVVHCGEDGVGIMFHNENPKSLLVLTDWIRTAMESLTREEHQTTPRIGKT